MVEVCFLAMGKPTQVDYAVSIIRNIEAHAANDVRYHMLVAFHRFMHVYRLAEPWPQPYPQP